MAPELKSAKKYDTKADVFSFGIVLLEIGTYEMPDDISDFLADFKPASEEAKWRALWTKNNPGSAAPERFVQLAKECLSSDPGQRPSFESIVKTLEDIHSKLPDDAAAGTGGGGGASGSSSSASAAPSSLAVPIENAEGREFWTKSFPGSSAKQPLVTVIGLLSKHTGIPIASLGAISKLIEDDKDKGSVTPKSFDAMLSWCGGLSVGLETAIYLAGQSAFVFHCAQDEAESKLSGKAEGTYLLRISSSRPGSFSLAVVREGKVRHSVILRDGIGYTVDKVNYFSSLAEFVKAHQFLMKIPYAK
eukprot:comp15502_c0_seq1/m.23666 comp15502_c0_seq1/g.23666  ORF comp15502_c0_seq1/g.23666 comp15502_c0_seq1/m.23666 type:complete len:304 (-) comp15502_c0_seq1:46-957(-)